MKQYDALEAKKHFSEILGNVINGESFVITKHGVQVAKIIPFSQKKKDITSIKEAIRTIRKLRKEITLKQKVEYPS